ncbi:MAG: diguanylate cyclase, partial [Magnetococcales bacterium]|nr:diguanylate cyclase [Magnetococcales bacterium]
MEVEKAAILLVDDDPDFALLLRRRLSKLKRFVMHYCQHPQKIMAEIAKSNPQVILLDLVMPQVDGLEVLAQLRANPTTCDIPVVILSSRDSPDDKAHAFSCGADDYLVKPTEPIELAARLTHHANAYNNQLRRLAAEEALRQNEARLANAQKIAHLGNWSWDLETQAFTWSDEAARIFGYGHQTVSPTIRNYLQAVHPEDRESARTLMEQALETPDSEYGLEHRIVRPDGAERIVHVLGEVNRDPDGKALSMVGTIQDITDYRHAEERLRIATEVFSSAMVRVEEVENQLHLTQRILERANEGVAITDAHGAIQSVNPAFSNITGYVSSDVLNRRDRLFRSDRHPNTFYKNIWDDLGKKGLWEGEVWNRRQNGEAYLERMIILGIENRNGEITNYVAIFNDITDIRQREEALRYQTSHDALTGLPNRTLLRDRLKQAVRQARRVNGQVAMMMFDLDLFKKVNESLGHAAGDKMLQEVAERTRQCLRGGDTVCRLGGDEFAIVLQEAQDYQDAMIVVKKLFSALSKPFLLENQELYITASVGITFFPEDGKNADDLIRNADIAMNRAKDTGRNNFQFFTATMDAHATRRLELEGQLRKALERQEFQLYYQPKVDMSTGKPLGMEALVRWQHDEMGMVSPMEFIPAAEETGLIVPLGLWILNEACQQTKKWLDAGHKNLQMAVNLSVRQVQQRNFVNDVARVLKETQLDPKHLELEITESLMMDSVEEVIKVLN